MRERGCVRERERVGVCVFEREMVCVCERERGSVQNGDDDDGDVGARTRCLRDVRPSQQLSGQVSN